MISMTNRVSFTSDDSIESILTQVESMWTAEGQSLLLDLANYDFARPHQLMLAVCIIKMLYKRSCIRRASIRHPKSESVKEYASRMDFYRALNLDLEEGFQRHSARGRFMEITEVDANNLDRVITRFAEIIQRNFDLPRPTLAGLHYSLVEILDNVERHSRSPINAWVCAQNYVDRVELCIIDGGIGVQASLAENPEYAQVTPQEAVQLAIKPGVTRDPRKESGMGMGLHYTSEIMRANGGRFELVSGTGRLLINRGQEVVSEGPYWPGTIVFMQFEKNGRLNEEMLARIFGGKRSVLVEDALYDNILW